MNITPVILCGGSGTRLWPLSRADYPKQFIKLEDNITLFQKTINRIKLIAEKNNRINKIIILTNESHRFLIIEQLKNIKISVKIQIILEPCSLNTAPALTLAANASPNSTLMVFPSDQYIENDKTFVDCIQNSINEIKDKLIFVFGVKPKSAEDSYGYILYKGSKKIKSVTGFIEKPKVEVIKKILADKKCFWNMGIFVLNAKTWLDAIRITNESIYENVTKSWKKNSPDNLFIRPSNSDYSKASSKSIDYAVIEKAISLGIELKAVEVKTNWSDIGQHKTLERLFEKNKKNNIFLGDVIEEGTNNTTVFGSDRHVSLLGVENLIVIDTKDSLLVVNKKSSSSMRELIKKINKKRRELLLEHSVVHRPWGTYEIILQHKNCKIKKIIVNPNSQLSYQSHKYRSEHWIILKGVATILKEGKEFKLCADESTYISSGQKHMLMNNQKQILEIIEVQTGKKLSEKDIIRYQDIYGRLKEDKK
jgi:mannose-1-phosphate guanylyltransferase/mannose-6-phosphate isomerase